MSIRDTHLPTDARLADTPTILLSDPDGRQSVRIRKFKLLAVSGPLQGREFVVDKDVYTVGSGPENDLVLEDSTVSRQHCEIQLATSGYHIRDLGSTNGTTVQGVRVSEAFLEQGTEFQLGKTRIVFCPLRESTEYALSRNDSFGSVLGQSVAMRRVFHLAETYAPTDATILIEGETGTGKELLAESIHHHSPRKDKRFVVIDCASLARELVESELFGHKKGAFTGATGDRVGAFEYADGGTVFLDEISELSADLQPKLLRVLEKREVRRLGSTRTVPLNVRIISATNRKLQHEVNAGRFREDLFFRLSVVRLALPPLRQRLEDIPLLATHFLSTAHNIQPDAIADFNRTMELLRVHSWPGNVRELRNLIEIAAYDTRRPINLSAFLYAGRVMTEHETAGPRFSADQPFKDAKQGLVRNFERDYVRDLLQRTGGNVSQAAREAGIERAYLQRLIRKHDLREDQAV